MQPSFHFFSDLFAQLGLDNSPEDIEAFLNKHSPLPDEVILAEASFWSPSQADFLRQAQTADSDWAEVVDALNVALRAK